MHAIGDPEDTYLTHTPEQLIDHAANLKFDVLAISCHGKVLFSKKLEAYAKKKGILLISGAEANIEKKHVLIFNITDKERESLKTFDDVRRLKKKKDILVIASHPFFPRPDCLKEQLIKNIDIFDAIEISHFYIRGFDFNKKAIRVAKKYSKPLMALSDSHFLWQLGKVYTRVDAKKNMRDFFKAVRNGKVAPVHQPMKLGEFFVELYWIATTTFKPKTLYTTRIQ